MVTVVMYSNNTPSLYCSFTFPQAAVSGVNEMMIKKTFTQWEPILNVVIPSSRFNGVSPGPRQVRTLQCACIMSSLQKFWQKVRDDAHDFRST